MARFQRLACPSCGGALDVPTAHAQFFTCATCGATLEDTQYTAPTQQISVSLADVFANSGIDTANLTAYAERAGRTASTVGKVIGTIVALVVVGSIAVAGLAIFAAVRDVSGVVGDDGFDMYSFATSTIVAGEGATGEGPVDQVVLAVSGADGMQLVYADLGGEQPVRWTAPLAELLPEDAYLAPYERVVAASDTVMVTHEDGLYAFDRATGATRYQLSLDDSFMNICSNCLRVFDDTTAVALTQDGTLRTWDVATGSGGWSLRLPGDVPRQLLDVAGNPAVITDVSDAGRSDGRTAEMTVYALSSGEVVHTQFPNCADSFSGTLRIYDQVVELPDGSYVWLNACIQRWQPGSDTPMWSVDAGDAAVPFGGLGGDVLVAADRLAFPTAGGLTTLALADGALATTPRTELAALHPVGIAGEVVVSLEQSSRGSRKWSVTGVTVGDVATPADWSFALDGAPALDRSITSDDVIVGVTSDGVVLAQFDIDGDALKFQVLDPASGAAAAPATLALGDLMFAHVVGWSGDELLLGADNRLLAIDPVTATIVSEAP